MNQIQTHNPLIVQGDQTVLVEVDNPRYEEARDGLVAFAELEKSPEHIHTYTITPLSVWNACAAGMDGEEMIGTLQEFAKYPVPDHVETRIRDYASRYGRLVISAEDGELRLETDDEALAEEIRGDEDVESFLQERLSPTAFRVHALNRGRVKQALIKVGYPARDVAGYTDGEELEVALAETTAAGEEFNLRPYQADAADAFYAGGSELGGSGVIVLPCGAGKTVVGMASMERVQASTLILVTNVTAARQWKKELLDKTTLTEDMVGLYHGRNKKIRPVTIASYQIMTWREDKDAEFKHLELFDERNWGLIIYDEVHLLPAPVFQVTAGLQARRRLGLTATLVREDGREEDVFALIGPKKADVPWKVLERQGWIAKAQCREVRLDMPEDHRMNYAVADRRRKFRVASENPRKADAVRFLLDQHPEEQALIMGLYVDQVRGLANDLDIPAITGSTGQTRRQELYAAFRRGEVQQMAVSKVANFAIDLPDVSVAIQVSGTFGSRQEEAQRLGRLLRPKNGRNQAHFYSIVSRDTVEQEFALKRQLFLCEQGYTYEILDAGEL